jgi:hypothetical protein
MTKIFFRVALALLDVMLLLVITDIITWKYGFALLGLCWDFLGALLGGGGLLLQYMAMVKRQDSEHRVPSRGDTPTLWALKIAFWFGPKQRDSNEWIGDQYSTVFWATFLLGFGFFFQAVSQLISS